MKERINQKLLSRLKPDEKPYDVRDDKLTGFILRVQPTGSMSYYVEWKRGKRECIGSVSKYMPQAARERAQQVLSASIGGRNPIAELTGC